MRERKARGNRAEMVVRARGWGIYVRTAVDDAGGAERPRRRAVGLVRRRSSGAHGPHDIRTYREIGRGGRVLRRPGLERLLADAETGRFEGVAVSDPARLARDAAQLAAVLARFEELGIEVVFADAALQMAGHDR